MKIVEIQKALLTDLKKATLTILNQRQVKSSSNLYNSIEWKEKDDVIQLIALDYFEWVDTGRRKGTSMIPPQDLIPWMKRVGITPSNGMSYGQLAFVIARAIKRNGIKAKSFTNPIIEASTDIISEELAIVISENICDELVASLTQNK
jgi:hypothetical protein